MNTYVKQEFWPDIRPDTRYPASRISGQPCRIPDSKKGWISGQLDIRYIPILYLCVLYLGKGCPSVPTLIVETGPICCLLSRLILIWDERQIFNRKLIAILSSIWKNRNRHRERSPHTPPLPQPKFVSSPLKRSFSPTTPSFHTSKRGNLEENEQHAGYCLFTWGNQHPYQTPIDLNKKNLRPQYPSFYSYLFKSFRLERKRT